MNKFIAFFLSSLFVSLTVYGNPDVFIKIKKSVSYPMYEEFRKLPREEIKKRLIDANAKGVKLFGADAGDLNSIINAYDEEIATLAVMNAEDLVSRLFCDSDTATNDFFFKSSKNFLHLLLDKGFTIQLRDLFFFENATGETLDHIIKKRGKNEFFSSEEFPDYLLEIIWHGRMDFLKAIESNGFKLSTIDLKEFNIQEILFNAVWSTNTTKGNEEMLNYVLDTLNQNGSGWVLAYSAGISDGVLFNKLLKKGYTIKPVGKEGKSGLARAIMAGNISTVKYFLELGINPDDVNWLEGIIENENIPLLELMISHGAKIGQEELSSVEEYGSRELIKYFKDKGYGITDPTDFNDNFES